MTKIRVTKNELRSLVKTLVKEQYDRDPDKIAADAARNARWSTHGIEDDNPYDGDMEIACETCGELYPVMYQSNHGECLKCDELRNDYE